MVFEELSEISEIRLKLTVGCLVNRLLLRYNIYICLEKIICTNAINSTSSSDRSYMPAQPADGE